MGVYLLIGLFLGIVMVGIYWGLPLSATGPKSLGRVVLILCTAPFIWPIQVAFYATRYLTGTNQSASGQGNSSDSHNACPKCVEMFETLKEQCGLRANDFLPAEKARDSKFVGMVLGVIDRIAAVSGEERSEAVKRVMALLFGQNAGAAMMKVQSGPDDPVFMESLEDAHDRLKACDSDVKVYRFFQSLVPFFK
jgi:hypothetical protein